MLLIGVVILVAALTFFPALLLGPIVQGLTDAAVLMRRDLLNLAHRACIVFTVLLGLAYPLAMTGDRQIALPEQGRRQPIERDGKVVGSELIGQASTGRSPRRAARTRRPRPRSALLPEPALGDRLRRRRHLLQQPRPEQPRARAAVRASSSPPTWSSSGPTTRA